jgi:isopentenyldiphosphate isomerase
MINAQADHFHDFTIPIRYECGGFRFLEMDDQGNTLTSEKLNFCPWCSRKIEPAEKDLES